MTVRDATGGLHARGRDAARALFACFGATHILFLHYALVPAAAWALTGAGAGLGAWAWVRSRRRSSATPALSPAERAERLALLVLALGLCVLGGEGHFVYANLDWMVRDGVLADLVLHRWPLSYELRGETLFLRAPLGMYLLPATIGKVAGLGAAHLAMLLQNAMLLWWVLVAFSGSARSSGQRWTGIAVFVVFSGMDIVPSALMGLGESLRSGTPFQIPSHLEWWAVRFQYSSHLTQLFWVPQHALAGWAFAAIYWDEARTGRFSWRPLALVPLLPLWSPLAAMGTLPFCVYVLWTGVWRRIDSTTLATLAAAGVLALPALLFLSTGGGTVEHEMQLLGLQFATRYLVFVPVEFGLFALLLRRSAPRPEWVLATATLLAIPFLRFGVANDFVMRASIPALALLSFLVAHALRLPETGRRWRRSLVAILLAGAVTPLSEVRAAVTMPVWPFSTCELLDAWMQQPRPIPRTTHYLVDATRFARLPVWAGASEKALVRHREVRCWDPPPEPRSTK